MDDGTLYFVQPSLRLDGDMYLRGSAQDAANECPGRSNPSPSVGSTVAVKQTDCSGSVFPPYLGHNFNCARQAVCLSVICGSVSWRAMIGRSEIAHLLISLPTLGGLSISRWKCTIRGGYHCSTLTRKGKEGGSSRLCQR